MLDERINRPAGSGAVLLLTGVLALLPAGAAGQQSRAEETAQRQAEKNTRLAPNTPTVGERALTWFESHFTDPDTAYLTFGGIYPSAGFAPGVAARAAVGHARIRGGGAYSIRGYKLAHASLSFPALANDKFEVGVASRWVDATQVPFYGIGTGSIKDDRVNYGLRALQLTGGAAVKPVSWFRIGGGLAWRRLEDREGVGSRPSIDTRHTPATAPGLFSEIRYTEATAFAAVDWRESPGYTRRGGLYSVALSDFRDREDQFSFRQLDVDLRQSIPLLKEHWVVALRGLVQTTMADDGQVIPYHLLPALGGAHTLRGYPDFRFQDRHLMLLTAEYRWLPSRIIDMALFVDAGKVAAARGDLDLNGLTTAWGLGIRFHGPTFTPLRLDVARGKEGIRAHITGSVGF